ncbi:MAG TPA: DNA repair ATPase [Sphingomicrobium sp.]|nr:DNA repair ATPase [Sphingomicrobium sp.]
MPKYNPVNNPVVLKRGVHIGSGNAENDDEFLFDCFVDYPPVEECMRMTSPRMIVAGRTGEGKTAILRHIEQASEHSAFIDPAEMSMSYVSNSDALRFLTVIGADLDLLFQVLWKHVLCIEFIRLRWSVDSTQKSKNIFARISEKFSRDERRKKAVSYLQEWQGKFWITMDQNIKEITEAYETKLNAEMGAEISKFKAGGQYEKRLSTEKKSELVARSRKIINADQLSELHGIIDMLSVSDGDQMKSFYLMIDRLDERWVDETVRFKLIKALIESLKNFRKIQNLKILVALRLDVFERVVQETTDIAFQREKFEDNMIRLVWSKSQIKELVDRRIESLFKRKYTSGAVRFEDVFPTKIANKDAFDWMTERTLMRPRDMIAFVNEALDSAAGQSTVSNASLRKAEGEFARKRRDALIQEWKSAHPALEKMLNIFTLHKKLMLEFQELLCDEDVEAIAVDLSDPAFAGDPVAAECQVFMTSKGADATVFMQMLVATLYRSGSVGLKLNTSEPYVYSHLNQPLVSRHLIRPNTKIRLHPMLHAAYHLYEA